MATILFLAHLQGVQLIGSSHKSREVLCGLPVGAAAHVQHLRHTSSMCMLRSVVESKL